MKDRGRPQDPSQLDLDLPLRPAPQDKGEAEGPLPEARDLPLFSQQEIPPREAPSEAEAPKKTAKEAPETAPESAAEAAPEAASVAEAPPSPAPAVPEPGAAADEAPAEPLGAEEPVSFGGRVLGGLADLAVHGGVLMLALLGQSLLGLTPSWEQAPAYGMFLLAFSFLYCVVPMAFWGQTPGMASLGLVVRTPEGENLTFPQTALRWAAGVLTLALLGLPLLVALSGRSLGDRWSGSETRRYAA